MDFVTELFLIVLIVVIKAQIPVIIVISKFNTIAQFEVLSIFIFSLTIREVNFSSNFFTSEFSEIAGSKPTILLSLKDETEFKFWNESTELRILNAKMINKQTEIIKTNGFIFLFFNLCLLYSVFSVPDFYFYFVKVNFLHHS